MINKAIAVNNIKWLVIGEFTSKVLQTTASSKGLPQILSITINSLEAAVTNVLESTENTVKTFRLAGPPALVTVRVTDEAFTFVLATKTVPQALICTVRSSANLDKSFMSVRGAKVLTNISRIVRYNVLKPCDNSAKVKKTQSKNTIGINPSVTPFMCRVFLCKASRITRVNVTFIAHPGTLLSLKTPVKAPVRSDA